MAQLRKQQARAPIASPRHPECLNESAMARAPARSAVRLQVASEVDALLDGRK
jgi:hypothetical protein